MKKILFLGYDETQTKLIDALIAINCLIDHTEDKIEAVSGYDFVMYGDLKIEFSNAVLKDEMMELTCVMRKLN